MTPAEIAAGLSEAGGRAIRHLDAQWTAGPSLPATVIDCLSGLLAVGLIEREFMDEGPASIIGNEREYSVRLSACWHFRLTEKGRAVRAILEKEVGDAG